MAMLVVGFLVLGAFINANQLNYLGLFTAILFATLGYRVILANYAKSSEIKHLSTFATYYVIASLIVGLDFAFFTVAYYDLQNSELRIFLTVVHLGMITAAVGSLAVWMPAYLAFCLPQIIGLMALFVLNDNIPMAAAVATFSMFILMIAKNFNLKFKEGRLLIDENITLISKMEKEIFTRKKAQVELEDYQQQLEGMVDSRTKELNSINDDLKNQIVLRKDIEKELEYLAYYDVLTQLPNRTLFVENLKKSLAQAKRNESLLGILFIDLDCFKKINDSHGRSIGDKLLKSVAERLSDILRDSDMIARNGGDEFVVLIESMKDVRESFVVANKILSVMNNKFNIDGHEIHIGASVGISLYPLDGDDALDLLKMSDTAMYEAKKIGHNNFQFYSSAMSHQISDRLHMENALRNALKNNEFFIVYQPQVNILTQETSGFEALIRWKNPEFGMVSPFHFIPILEETGLIYSVGEWVILEVLKFIKSGKSNNTKVSINLSALQCGINDYSHQIKDFIEKAGVDASLVEFEITESLLISDFSQTEMFLTDISQLGCTIALDDFGTGYTSFSYLTKLPIDIIKIDRSLITGIEQNKNLQDIVRAIVTMSESLGIHNVFEGVENEDELQMVKQLNGEIIQGYLFSKPLELTQIDAWFSDKTYLKSSTG